MKTIHKGTSINSQQFTKDCSLRGNDVWFKFLLFPTFVFFYFGWFWSSLFPNSFFMLSTQKIFLKPPKTIKNKHSLVYPTLSHLYSPAIMLFVTCRGIIDIIVFLFFSLPVFLPLLVIFCHQFFVHSACDCDQLNKLLLYVEPIIISLTAICS
jgi:hypothetical protein